MIFFIKRIAYGIRRRVLGDRHVNAYYRIKAALADGEMLFLPEPPHHPGYMIGKVCAELGLRPVNMPGHQPIGFFFQDRTRTDYTAPRDGLLNERCTDISKQNIEQTFEHVFGYPLAIDPLTYQGQAVCKSDENATHDGRIIECPIEEREPGAVYEVLIENSISENAVQDIRIVVVGNRLPIAYLKNNWKERRFANWTFEVRLAKASDVLSKQEQDLVITFARAIGLDFGELDTLRDRQTGRLYIVDAAKTAFGPPGRLGFFSKVKAVKIVARAFKEEFIRGD
jgi:hypothetical protein